jgi:hypothetical protein
LEGDLTFVSPSSSRTFVLHSLGARLNHVHNIIAIAVSALALAGNPVDVQSRHERKAQQAADSASPKNVSGGVTFQNPTPIDKTFEIVVTN